MFTRSQRTDAQPHDGQDEFDPALSTADDETPGLASWHADETIIEEEPERAHGATILGIVLVLLGLSWMGAFGWSMASRPGPFDPLALIDRAALFVAPLILLGIAWLILGHSSRRETQRFTRAVARMRAESAALESTLELIANRLDENHARLTNEAAKLMSLGDEASDRLGRVTYYLSKEGKNLGRLADSLEAAAANAKVDIGVLLHDLPRAEEQALALAATMREAGMEAHQQAGALEGQVAALAARGREADDIVGGAAQRLGSHLARIESTAAAATGRLDEAATGMTAAVDGSMARASEAIEQTRQSLDAQGAAMLAAVEQNRAALETAGNEAARRLGERVDRIGAKLAGISRLLGEQDAASGALVERLQGELVELEERFTGLRDAGVSGAGLLNESFGTVRTCAQALFEELGGGHDRAGALIDRVQELALLLAGIGERLEGPVPDALMRVEAQAARAAITADALLPQMGAIERAADGTMGTLVQAETTAASHRAHVEALAVALGEQLGQLEARVAAVREAGGEEADALAASLEGTRAAAAALGADLGSSSERAAELGRQVEELGGAMARMPEALAGADTQVARVRETTAAIAPEIDAIREAAEVTLARLADTEVGVARQRSGIETLLADLGSGADTAEAQLRAIGAAAGEAERASARLTAETGPELIEALLRVREAAQQAAERARETISAVIPQSVANLAEQSRDAVAEAISAPIEQQMGAVVKVTEAAVEAARNASERLTRQMLTIGGATAAIEERIEAARKAREEQEGESLARHVALLIESLNSTAIDVTKILSNEVTDGAWTAYLKGDRGIFTRRAVRLLDAGESREILRHYEEERDFRDHVNRYIHDFETMMRRILADRDASPLGVTILSSDMGKLYVALAQAIERLRR